MATVDDFIKRRDRKLVCERCGNPAARLHSDGPELVCRDCLARKYGEARDEALVFSMATSLKGR